MKKTLIGIFTVSLILLIISFIPLISPKGYTSEKVCKEYIADNISWFEKSKQFTTRGDIIDSTITTYTYIILVNGRISDSTTRRNVDYELPRH